MRMGVNESALIRIALAFLAKIEELKQYALQVCVERLSGSRL